MNQAAMSAKRTPVIDLLEVEEIHTTSNGRSSIIQLDEGLPQNSTNFAVTKGKRRRREIVDLSEAESESVVDLTDGAASAFKSKSSLATTQNDSGRKFATNLHDSRHSTRLNAPCSQNSLLGHSISSKVNRGKTLDVVDLQNTEDLSLLQHLPSSASQYQSVLYRLRSSCPTIDVLKIEKVNDPRRRRKFEAHRFFLAESKVTFTFQNG
jgi:hypothetical protein